MTSLLPSVTRKRPPARRVTLTAPVAQAVPAYGVTALPAECCGFLVGSWRDGDVEVFDAWPAANATMRSPASRFLIRAEAVLGAIRRAAKTGRELVGFYHSHPDGAPTPSAVDVEQPWLGFVHLIVALPPAGPGTLTAWTFPDPGCPARRLALDKVPVKPRAQRN